MNHRSVLPRVRTVILVGLLLLAAPLMARAQDATPVGSSQGITLAASGLRSPAGVHLGA